ncbi:hypothetical protein HK101_008308 [Irineochytrium annulatum]|nr:hypothetical protein HK101_008308 [Irineochytrium annulatum]
MSHNPYADIGRGRNHDAADDDDGAQIGMSPTSAYVYSLLTAYNVPTGAAHVLSDKHTLAFLLSFVASLGTFLGGVVVLFLVHAIGLSPGNRAHSAATSRLIGVLQAFSAGVMLYMTFIDLVPESIEAIGSRETMVWFFAGVAVFGVLETVVLPDEAHEAHGHSHGGAKDATEEKEKETKGSSSKKKGAGKVEKQGGNKKAGSRKDDDEKEEDEDEGADENEPLAVGDSTTDITSEEGKRQLMRTSLITFYALLLHNMPEGLGVYLSALSDVKLGLQLAVAICLHNIPEGMAVAIPLFAAQASSSRVLFLTLLNGLAEPAGVIVGALLLGPWLTPATLSRCLAGVAGIMCCISLHELYPTALRYAGQARSTLALFAGMLVVFLALETVTEFFGHAHAHGGGGHGNVEDDHGHGHAHAHGSGQGHSHGGAREAEPVLKPVVKMGPVSGIFVGKDAGSHGHGHAHAHGGHDHGHGHAHAHGGHGHAHGSHGHAHGAHGHAHH